MRAVLTDAPGGVDRLRPAEVPVPEPGPTEVLVRVHAAGVNPVDWKTRSGAGVAAVLGDPPWILGWDVSGVVEEIGPGVTRFAPSDPVFGMPRFPRQAGAYAEYVSAPSRQFARVPESLDPVHAAGLPLAALTAWQALIDTADVRPGQRVLVHAAAGGVGHLAVQIARWRGAHVVATASAPKHDLVLAWGADEVIDHTTTRFEDVTGGVDVVLDLVGGDVTQRSLAVVRPGGLLLAIPSAAGLPDRAELGRRGVRALHMLVEPDGRALEDIARLVSDGHLAVHVQETAALEDVARLHRVGEAGRTVGKLVAVV